jgi:hypothetical protein
MRATILAWSTVSGLVLGLMAGTMAFAVIVLGAELTSGAIPRLAGRARVAVVVFTFLLLPLAGAMVGWLEGRLKLR